MVARKPLEKDVESAIRRYAISKGCYVRKFVSPANRSVPDKLIVAPGGAVGFLEVKRPGQVPTKAQAAEMRELKKIGANVDWCDNVADGKAFVSELLLKGMGLWKPTREEDLFTW